MSESVFVRECDLGSVEKLIRSTLEDVQKGKYDADLKPAGITVPANLLDGLKISKSGQGMSPNEWMELVAIFGPTAATMAKDIWTIVIVPKLKQAFRDDCVSAKNPNENK